MKNNNDKDFFEINSILKRMGYSQIVFPKKIKKEKTLQDIREASSSLYKIDKKLKACDLIDKELLKNKTAESGQIQPKNFEIYLKIRKQSLVSEANKIVFRLYSIQLPPSFNDKFNNISLQNRIKKFNQKVDRLTKKLEKKVKIIASDDTGGNASILRQISRLQKNYEKLQLILDILPNSKEQSENKCFVA